ncbi:MAG: tetratricopeptide repeat protein [Candidatus Omnitrophica bacterium]|nr:tetratricopeptide repeat protein [Candidatus Omnitrophota bacterium]
MRKLKIIIALFVILIITFVSLYPSLKNNFTNWDDTRYVTENGLIQSLSLRNIEKIFTSFISGNYHPFTILSYSFEYSFFKLNPFPYHLDNLILHLANCCLVFWLIYLLTDNILLSFVTAMLFGIHPLHVESVAWVSGRKDLLAALFSFGAIIFYLQYRKEKRISKYYYISLLLFLCSVLSKSTVVMLPIVLWLIDYLTYRDYDKKLLLDKIPFCIVSAVFIILAIFAQYSLNALEDFNVVRNIGSWSIWERVVIPGYALIFYTCKAIVPIKLSCLYFYYGIPKQELIVCILVVIMFGVTVFISRVSLRKVVFGYGFFLIMLLPALLWKPIGSFVVADRYAYIPLLGILFIVGVFADLIYKRWSRSGSLFLLLFFTVTLLFSVSSWERCCVWKNSISLWEDAVKNTKYNAVAFYSLGNAYQDAGDNEKAIKNYLQAINIKKDYVDAYNNICNIYVAMGEYAKAIAAGKQAIGLNPAHYKAYYNLGSAYDKLSEKKNAIEALRKAIEVNPDYIPAINDLAAVYSDNGEVDKAIELWNRIIQIDQNFITAHFNLAVFYFKKGNHDMAIKHADIVTGLGGIIDPAFLKLIQPFRNKEDIKEPRIIYNQ